MVMIEPRVNPCFEFIVRAAQIREENERQETIIGIVCFVIGLAVKIAFIVWLKR